MIRDRIKYFIIRKVAKILIYALVGSCRWQVEGAEVVETYRRQGIPIIYVYWHRHILMTIYHFRQTRARPLISLSRDGELVAQVAEEFGMKPVRGSSSRGGARAFLEMVNSIKEEHAEVLITADGPKGPAGRVKDGTLQLAMKTGAVIIPLCWHGSHVKMLEKTWDKFKIPRLFSRVIYAYGSPFMVPPDARREDYPRLKENLEHLLDDLEENTVKRFEKC